MIDVTLQPGTLIGDETHFCYRLAHHDLRLDLALPVLVGFEQTFESKVKLRSRTEKPNKQSDESELYHGPGWIGNVWRQVTGFSIPWGYRIDVAGIGVYEIAENGDHIVLAEKEQKVGWDLVIEALLGPALILALGLHGVYCLHASAALVDGNALAFVGESGKGKSTLARWLDTHGKGSWRRIGDDVLPVSMRSDGSVDVLPHFPQLKIAALNQPSAGVPERVPLAAVYVLDRPAVGGRVEIRRMGAQEGALALLRHTVASRLFDGDLLRKHLDFCVQAASDIPAHRLIYPLIPEALQELSEALADDLKAQQLSMTDLASRNT